MLLRPAEIMFFDYNQNSGTKKLFSIPTERYKFTVTIDAFHLQKSRSRLFLALTLLTL